MAVHILLVLDDPQRADHIRRAVEGLGETVESVSSLAEATERARAAAPDLVLVTLSGNTGTTDAIRSLKAVAPTAQVAVLAGGPFADATVPAALAAGARTVLSLPLEQAQLADLVERVRRAAGRRRADRARARAHERAFGFEHAVGRSPAFTAAVAEARRVASSASTSCLLLGETGTGKDLLARAIHYESVRSGGPFVEVNCAAIPPNLLESELFGHEQGAFTDAVSERAGLCEVADGGTLFLDEVGELPLGLQAKLLRFLDTRSFRRLAGTETISVDVRIVAATNRDLTAAVRGERFRADLFYRLHVVAIALPPLRERGEDVQMLADAFLAGSARMLGRGTPPGLTQAARAALCAYRWPGNVRELAHVIERAVLLSQTPVLDVDDLRLEREPPRAGDIVVRQKDGGIAAEMPPSGVALADVEAALVRAALTITAGNVVAAARLLRVGRGALRSRLRRLQLDPATYARGLERHEGPPGQADAA